LNHHLLLVQSTLWLGNQISYPSDAWTTITVFDVIGNTFVSGTQTGEVIVREDEKEPTRFDAIPGR